MTYRPQSGDIGLSGTKSQGVVSLAIRLGSVLRHEDEAGAIAKGVFFFVPILTPLFGALLWDNESAVDIIGGFVIGLVVAVAAVVLLAALYGFRSKNKTWFSHSFIVHHVDEHVGGANAGVWITESHAKGVETRPLHYPPGEFVWLKTSVLLSGDDEAEMRAFLDAVTTARWKYDYWTFAGLAVYSITGAMLVPPTVGTAICSGLTSEALTRGKAIWPLPAYRMMPQDQWWAALNQGIGTVETG